MRPLLTMAAAARVLAFAGGCASSSPDTVHVEGRTFRDAQGRQLLFRGYNAKVDGIFDAKFSDGRTPNETFPSFDEAGAARFEQLGFSALRLPMNWSAIEPQPKQYSADFFAKLQSVLDAAKRHRFYVILDMHQDAYSKEIGEDGAPLWAIVPPPPALLSGPSDDSRRLSGPVLQAGFSFFADARATDGRNLQEAFIAAVQEVARRVAGNPVVLGYEAFNEPVVLTLDQLNAFHTKFADAIHVIDRNAPVLFEPVALRNQTDQATIPAAPWTHGPGAYAVHIYTAWFSVPSQNNWASENPQDLAPSMQHTDLEAAGWATPMFVTEFGCDQTVPQGPLWLAAELDLQDRYLASSTLWEFSGLGAWGFRGTDGNERPTTTRIVSRMYPRAVAGDLLAIERPAPGHMLVRWQETTRTRGLPHEVAVSNDSLTDYQVLCDGQAVSFTQATGRAVFTCPRGGGDRTFEVIGTPAP